ncbi:MAG: DNA repair protein RecO [Chloroflexi bacterium]|nr:DNA repair protein RecO [Chloroflexota bacterium]
MPRTSSRSYRTEGIVLRRTEAGEADRIVTFYTPDLGKIRALAKGVRKPKSKLGNLVELFTHSSLMLAHGRSLDVVQQGEPLHPFLPLKTDLHRSGCAFYVAELVSRFTMERLENRRLFDLLLATLEGLCEEENVALLLRHFEMGLLQCQGYRPNLHRCVSCNSLLLPEANYFSASGGGILCPSCARAGAEPLARPVSVDAIKVLRLMQSADFATVNRVRIKPALAQELENLLRGYIEYLLEARVKSAAWLDRVKAPGPAGDRPVAPTNPPPS